MVIAKILDRGRCGDALTNIMNKETIAFWERLAAMACAAAVILGYLVFMIVLAVWGK